MHYRALCINQRAATLVEAAVVIPVVVLFLGFLFEMGNYFKEEMDLTAALREGLKTAAADPNLASTDTAKVTAAKSRVQAVMTPLLNYPGVTITVGTPESRFYLVNNNGQLCAKTISVTASFQHQPLIFGRFRLSRMNTISRTASMRYQGGQPLCS